MQSQQTVAGPVQISGIGLHTGRQSEVTVAPAAENTGFVFQRTDAKGGGQRLRVQAHHAMVLPYCSGLGENGRIMVRTCEHLMAALYATGVDNAEIFMDGEEVPICDGSAMQMANAITAVGTVDQGTARKYIKILNPIRLQIGDSEMVLEPASGFHIDLQSWVPGFGKQDYCGAADPESALSEIIPARTFGLVKNIWPCVFSKMLGYPPIGRGVSRKTLMILHNDKLLNRGGFRFPNELARHRALDAIGDLYLLGARILGRYRVVKTKHRYNHEMTRTLMQRTSDWVWTDSDG